MWFKKDLRIADHKPLYEACQQAFPVIAFYVREPHIMQADDYSHFHQYWIQESLKDLKQSLSQLNIPLLMRYGEMSQVLDIIKEYYEITNIYAHEETGNHLTYTRDIWIISYCKENNILLHEYPHNGIVRKLKSRDAWSHIHKQRMNDTIIPIPHPQSPVVIHEGLQKQAHTSFTTFLKADKPSTWIYAHDIPWELAAKKRLSYFLIHASWYRYALSRPHESVLDSSRLSAYITFGNLSMRQIHQAILWQIQQFKTMENKKKEISWLLACYQRLFWRCHFIQKLESQPNIEFDNQNYHFNSIRKKVNTDYIDARYSGNTGFPMIDAGMRCLHATGRINFRMRATIVSFICNTCMQPRESIGPMLAKLFVDYEPGIHYSQLQMQSGTTWINTIRIYNPIKQLEEKDSKLQFVRRRIPELDDLSSDQIFSLGTVGWTLVLDTYHHPYPRPIVDLVYANRQAKVALRSVMKHKDTQLESQKVFRTLWSKKKSSRKKTVSQKSSVWSSPPVWSLFDIS